MRMGIRTAAFASLIVSVLALVVASPSLLHGQPQPLFRGGTELVDLYVTVTDDDGRLVPNLLQDDFTIFDEKQQQDIAVFENDVRPITVVVMLDTSASMAPSLDLLNASAEQFLIRLLPDDRGRVGAFNDKIQIEPPAFTGDRDVLIDSLSDLDFGNPTRLYDAVSESLNALQGIEGRRVIVVFTDGDDTSGGGRSDDLRDRSREQLLQRRATGALSAGSQPQEVRRRNRRRVLRAAANR